MVASGNVWLPASLQTQMAAQPAEPGGMNALSPREREIAALRRRRACANAEIAEELSISEETVKTTPHERSSARSAFAIASSSRPTPRTGSS